MNNEVKNIKKAVIIGAGPAGLTAAYELIKHSDIQPIVFEQDSQVGGLSRTVNYKGNRIDIGGHRFFSKSDTVTNWWQEILPLQTAPSKDDLILQKNVSYFKYSDKTFDPEKIDQVMLVRNRLSRIFFLRKFFSYPISLSLDTLLNLGFVRIIKIGFSYLKIRLFPIKNEKTLQDFFINRFGMQLYLTFFKDYTQKVWGVECNQISASWGAQRIKGLSISKAILHAIKNIFSKNKSIDQKKTETSLIEKFMYPKFGPGQMWEEVAKKFEQKGGKVFLNTNVVGIKTENNKVVSIDVKDENSDQIQTVKADYFFSSMPIKDLINDFQHFVPQDVKEIANGLAYRDFITAGLLIKKLKIKNETKLKTVNNIIPDTWIYIQERDVKVGRIQMFNNWSPYMVKDLNNIWLGLEYFCNQGDELWQKSDEEFKEFAINELCKIGFIEQVDDVIDSVIIRMPKTYPAYFGTYDQFGLIKDFLDQFENLFLIGRNGMHRYNNMDHSMLSAMQAVKNIINKEKSKDNIWAVNTQEEYHEEKAE